MNLDAWSGRIARTAQISREHGGTEGQRKAESDVVDSMPDAMTRLAAALEKLDTNYNVPNNEIPYRFFIPGIARQLALMKRRGISSKEVRAEAKEIETLASDARSLSLRIRDLPPAGDVSLSLDATGMFRFSELADLLNKLADAAQSVATAKVIPTGKIGRPTSSAADDFVVYICKEYERLTGNRPTLRVRDGKAAGPILDLVKDVFDALRIDASPEATIRRVKATGYPPGLPLTPSVPKVMEKRKKRLP